jgi:hypothetical protein
MISLSGIVNFGYLLPDLGQTLNLGEAIGFGGKLGVAAVILRLHCQKNTIRFILDYSQTEISI